MGKVKKYLIIITLILIFIPTGCSNSLSQYNKSAKEFYKVYFDIVEFIDLGNTLKSLEQLQKEENIKRIDQLGDLVEEIKKDIPKNKEQYINAIDERYNNLVFLKNSYAEFKSLSVDDKIKINSILISIGLDKKNWKDKKSSIIWY